jgi:2,4-didehydro-3-deoxy-L-rhamnonate hydrolase
MKKIKRAWEGSMNGTAFKLAMYAGNPGGHFAAIVLGDTAFDIATVYPAYRQSPRGKTGPLTAIDSLQAMLEGWDHNFPVLQEMVAFIEQEGTDSARFTHDRAKLDSLRVLPPIARPGKIFNAAQNFQEHVDEMLRAGMTPAGGPQFTGAKTTSHPYLFFKAPSALCGAYGHRDPARHGEDRLGGGDRLRDLETGQARQSGKGARAYRRLHDDERRLLPRYPDPA